MRDSILDALRRASGEKQVNLEFPANEDFGDYSTSLAMTLAKRDGKPPKDNAQELAKKLQKDPKLTKLVSKVEVAGPGFINFYLSKDILLGVLEQINKEKEMFGSSTEGRGKTVVIDYSSPNIAKMFGIGHLRSTIIGHSLYNLYKFLGYKTIGDNHLGDWGTQFGTLLYQVTSKNLDLKDLNIEKLEELYVGFNKEAEEKPELWDQARSWFKKLENGDSQARKLWKGMVDISLSEFNRIYKLLGVKIDYAYGESFYEEYMPKVIALVKEKGLSKRSEGAEIVEFDKLPPAMLVKSDGATTYFTRDLATILFRIESWDPELFVYEVGSEQTLHFRQLFETVKLLGWQGKKEFVHVGHGLIRFERGKMSTRRGKTVRLEDVLKEAIKKAEKIIDESETGRGLGKEERKKVADAVGIGAVKYFDLSHHPATDIIFDWGKMFVLEGASAPYLQYTVARTNSVLSKAKPSKVKGEREPNSEELSVMRHLSRFPEIVGLAAKNFSPNLLAAYLFELAQKYNNFYNQHRIIGGENEVLRLNLTSGCGQVLKKGLTILGIETPERM
jgi:arginyl-tRNA synthetase